MNATKEIEAPCIRQGRPSRRVVSYHLRWDCVSQSPIFSINNEDYEIHEFPADGGRAFTLKRGDKVYSIFVAISDGYPLCCCRGFEARGYCKHVSALTDAVQTGVFDGRWDMQPEEHPSAEQSAEEIPF